MHNDSTILHGQVTPSSKKNVQSNRFTWARKKIGLTFHMKYWFVNKDPYFMVCYNPKYRCVDVTPPKFIQQFTRVFFCHCSRLLAEDCRPNKGHSTCRSMLRPKQRVAWILQFMGNPIGFAPFPQTPMPRKSPQKNKAFFQGTMKPTNFP